MKKIYTISLALLMAGTVVAQKTMVKKGRILEEGTCSFTKKGANSTVSTNNQAKGITATLNETFEGLVPAAGWAAADWAQSDATQESYATGHTTHFAYFDAYNLAAGTEGFLVTPQLQPIVGNNTLSYKVQNYLLDAGYVTAGAGPQLYIEFSTDQGVTWTTSTTNVLTTLTYWGTTTAPTTWTTKTASLAAYNGLNVMVRFRAVSDWGGNDIGIDNVTGPNVLLYTNDISTNKLFASINAFDYFVAIPNSQLDAVYYGEAIRNNGTAAQTNVTVTANVNSGAFTSSTGLNNPTASLAAGVTDTLYATTNPVGSGFTKFAAQVSATQTEVDEFPANNMADSVTFYGTDASYYRTVDINHIINSYSFGSATPITGFEYGATYYMQNAGRVDSITSIIYRKSAGSANVVGKLYTVDAAGVYTLVAQTAAFTPATGTNTGLNFTTLALTTPYTAAAGTILAATIQINGTNFTTAPADTISIGYDNAYIGNSAVACTAYLNVGGTMDWYTFAGVPNVGIELQALATGVNSVNVNNTVSVYPNPAKDVINIKNAGKDAVITIMNSLGQVVYTTVATDKAAIDTKNLPEGVYFVKVNNQISKVVITK